MQMTGNERKQHSDALGTLLPVRPDGHLIYIGCSVIAMIPEFAIGHLNFIVFKCLQQ